MKQQVRHCSECDKELWYNNTTGMCREHAEFFKRRKLRKKCNENACNAVLTDNNKSGFCFDHCKSINASGEKNPMFGKNLYGTWLTKYGEVYADHKLTSKKEKHAANTKKKWECKEYREKVKNGTTGKKRSIEFRQLQSTNARKQMQDPAQLKVRADCMNKSYEQGLLNGGAGGTLFSSVKGYHEGYYYASKCELDRIKFLIESGATWKRYTVKDFDWRIKYTYEGKEHLYIPDFVIYGEEIIVEEIKSSVKRMTEVEKVKAAAAALLLDKFGIKYRVVDSATLPLKFVSTFPISAVPHLPSVLS